MEKIFYDNKTLEIISKYKDSKIIYNHSIITETDKPIEFDMHTHDICELIYLKKGDVSCIIGGKTYKLFKDSLIIFRPHIPHRVVVNDSDSYERYNILFDEKFFANKAFERVPENLDVVNYSGNSYIDNLFKKIDYYYNKFDKKDLKLLVRNIIEELIMNLIIATESRTNEGLLSDNPVLNHAVEYIDKVYSENITLEDICSHLYITKSHLHHLFTEFIKISPKKYINSKRLAKARELLRTGKKPLDVYPLCGFTDYVTFFRNYKNHFGHPPSKENDFEIERKIES